MLYGWKENSMLTNCLAACAYLTISVSEIERDICEKIAILSYPLAFDAPVRGVPVGISAPPLVWKNQNGVATRRWKISKIMFIRFDVIHERDGRTDGQTDKTHDNKDRAYASHRAVIKMWPRYLHSWTCSSSLPLTVKVGKYYSRYIRSNRFFLAHGPCYHSQHF